MSSENSSRVDSTALARLFDDQNSVLRFSKYFLVIKLHEKLSSAIFRLLQGFYMPMYFGKAMS